MKLYKLDMYMENDIYIKYIENDINIKYKILKYKDKNN